MQGEKPEQPAAPQPKKFMRLKDHFNETVNAGLTVAPSLYLLSHNAGVGWKGILLTCGLYAGMYFGVKNAFGGTPAKQETISDLIINVTTVEPPEHVKDMFADLTQKSEKAKIVTLHMDDGRYSSENFYNAGASGKKIVIGGGVIEDLKPDELKWVLAHEISHIETGDTDSRLAQNAFSSGTLLIGTVASAMPVIQVGLASDSSGHFASLIAAWAVMGLQLAAQGLHQTLLSRHICRQEEYRADRNALMLTGDFKSAVNAMKALDSANRGDRKALMTPFYTHPSWGSRIKRLSKENPPAP